MQVSRNERASAAHRPRRRNEPRWSRRGHPRRAAQCNEQPRGGQRRGGAGHLCRLRQGRCSRHPVQAHRRCRMGIGYHHNDDIPWLKSGRGRDHVGNFFATLRGFRFDRFRGHGGARERRVGGRPDSPRHHLDGDRRSNCRTLRATGLALRPDRYGLLDPPRHRYAPARPRAPADLREHPPPYPGHLRPAHHPLNNRYLRLVILLRMIVPYWHGGRA